MKKLKFTFWLLGFGCGVTVTGIIGAFVSLKIEAPKNDQVTIYEKKVEVTPSTQPTGELPVVMSESPKEEQVVNDTEKASVEEKQEEIKKPTPEPSEAISQKEEIVYKAIDIPKSASAKQICDLLEKEGFIEDSEAFLDYIRSQKKQRFLLHGKLSLPVGASMEVLLDELTV